jgi:hypothetical protein
MTRHNEQLLLTAPHYGSSWLISFASRILLVAPQQNCRRYADAIGIV